MPPLARFSRDIWDYLNDMPYMPSRGDRDTLVKIAQEDKSKIKRVKLWDYFFRIKPEDIGKPQKRALETILNYKTSQTLFLRADVMSWYFFSLKVFLIGGISWVIFLGHEKIKKVAQNFIESVISICPSCMSPNAGSDFYVFLDQFWIFSLLLTASSIAIASYHFYSHQTEIKKLEEACEERIAYLNKSILSLQKRIPSPPSDVQVHEWLKEDLDILTQLAKEYTNLETRLVDLSDNAPNPLCIVGPAELQNQSRIPPQLRAQEDKAKHRKARKIVFLPDGLFEDFYGTYYIQFILVASDMLGSYSCFYDFINNQYINARTSEEYYKDVVALNTREEYREIEVGSTRLPIENAPTFEMSLASGDKIEVTFASKEYFMGINALEGNSLYINPEIWVRNPEVAAKTAIKALRLHLRKHKSVVEAR